MRGRTFLDTNVLVYLFDRDEPRKQARARELIADEALFLVVSTQVLSEFYVVATRKLARPLDAAAASLAVDRFSEFFVVGSDAAMVRAAIGTAQRSQLSYWDAMIVEAAVSANCERILTEDLNPGSTIRGMRIENPF